MKKVLTMLLCFVLTLSIALATGCGGDATFNGNYSEASVVNTAAFAEKVENAEGKQEIDTAKGIEMTFKLEGSDSAEGITESITMNMSLKSAIKDEKFSFAGKVDGITKCTGEQDEKEAMEMYYSDGKFYVNENGDKMYVELDMEAAISQVENGLSQAFYQIQSLEELLAEFTVMPGAKIYIDDNENTPKIKFEYKVEADGLKTEMLTVMVFDKDYNLTAYKMEMKISGVMDGVNGSTNMSMTIKPYSGNIDLPSDLDAYVNEGLD